MEWFSFCAKNNTMQLYELKNIDHRYNNRTVLRIGQWQTRLHSIIGLAGPNGSGKSTMLRLLGFVERPWQGSIRFCGNTANGRYTTLRRQVALLPQASHLLKRSVYRNIAYGLAARKDVQHLTDRIHNVMQWVGLPPAAFAQRPWFALSGGEARRAALAARLVLRPQVLLLDEPTASVDEASNQLIKEAILKVHHEWKTTLVICSHDIQWLQDICNGVVYLFRGRIAGTNQPTLIFGPWKLRQDGRWAKKMTENQYFIAAAAAGHSREAVAAISSNNLTIKSKINTDNSKRCSLKGTLTRLNMNKATGRINARVTVGKNTFSVELTPEQVCTTEFYPGRRIWLEYNPEDVCWYE
ncbi:MAG: ATP-binding cassette domain-containing protein [Desulfobacteraceae bacterium]|nr:ATP-binding cassette domain-containing protein [Desulfobacteraceae bacterium]